MLTITKLAWQKKLREADLSHSEYRVLLTISTYTDKQGCHAHPGWDRLAKDVRMDKRNVKRAVSALIEKGWLRLSVKGGNEIGYRQADEYELTLPADVKGVPTTPLDEGGSQPESHANRTPIAPETRGVVRSEGVLSGAGKGVPTTPPSDQLHQVLGAKRPSSDAEHRSRSAATTASRQAARSTLAGVQTPPPPAGRTWSDLHADYDLMEEWLEEHLPLSSAGYTTAHAMWEKESHPKAIYNAVAKASA